MAKEQGPKSSKRIRADRVKKFRCKNLIVVLEEPVDFRNVGTAIRNVDALGAERTYVIDSRGLFPKTWEEMRERSSLMSTSASAIKWTFVKTFNSTEECIVHLKKKGFVSMVTSPHIKGKNNVALDEGDFTQSKLAVWFGNEKRGISALAIENAEACVSIPMYGLIESLNLGTTTGIVLYEVTKQRRRYQEKYKRAGRRRPRAKPLPGAHQV